MKFYNEKWVQAYICKHNGIIKVGDFSYVNLSFLPPLQNVTKLGQEQISLFTLQGNNTFIVCILGLLKNGFTKRFYILLLKIINNILPLFCCFPLISVKTSTRQLAISLAKLPMRVTH